jgi:flavin-dependent dehydrogenase
MADLARNAGAEYALDSPVQDIKVEKDRVRIDVSRSGEKLTFEARAAVIASGFNPEMTEKLGLGSFGDFVVGAQAEVETAGIEEIEVYFGQKIAPGFFAWLVPLSAHTARAGLLSRKNTGAYLKKFIASLLAEGKITSAEAGLSYGGIPLKPPRRTCGRRIIAVGDAAGQVKPTTGGGIYYGLLCADIAADTLFQALEADDLSARSLSRYEEEWKRRLGRELKIGRWSRKLFERLSDDRIDRIFDTIKNNAIDEALLGASELSFDWHGKAVLRLLGHRAVSRAMKVIRVPFRFRED